MTVDLEDDPAYTALSYTWEIDYAVPYFLVDTINGKVKNTVFDVWNNLIGSRPGGVSNRESAAGDAGSLVDTIRDKCVQAKRNILIDGHPFPVLPNLYDALIRLRGPRRGNSKTQNRGTAAVAYYWIDAICINQADPAERGAQVQMMGRIYSCASHVSVWLGTYPSLLSPGVKKLLTTPISLLPDATALRRRLTLGSPLTDASLYILISAAIMLLTRRWFSRLWVVQELCLATDVVFLLGDGDLEFREDTLRSAYGWIAKVMDREYWDIVYRFDAMKAVNPGTHIKHLPLSLELREKLLREGRKISVEEWLEMSRGRQASDARDMVFGGLYMMLDSSVQISSLLLLRPVDGVAQEETRLWPCLTANYEAEAPEVFLNLAACLLSRPGWTSLLSVASRYPTGQSFLAAAADGIKQQPQSVFHVDIALQAPIADDGFAQHISAALPSWVPAPGSWESDALPSLLHLGGVGYCASIPCSSGGNRSASRGGGEDTRPRISADGRTLYMYAAVVDVVQERTITGRRTYDKSSPYGLDSPIGFLEGALRMRREYQASRVLGDRQRVEAGNMTHGDDYMDADGGEDEYFTSVSLGPEGMDFTPATATPRMAPSTNSGSGDFLVTLAKTLTAGLWEGIDDVTGAPGLDEADDIDDSKPHHQRERDRMVGFCQHVDAMVRDELVQLRETEAAAKDNLAMIRDISARLQGSYEALRAAFPEQPWPETNLSGFGASAGADTPGKLHRRPMTPRLWSSNSNNKSTFNIYGPKSPPLPPRPGTQERERLESQVTLEKYRSAQEAVLPWRCVYTTAEGNLALAPAWARRGDRIMLIQGGRVPYVFTRADELWKRKLAEMRKALQGSMSSGRPLGKKEGSTKMEMEREIAELETKLDAVKKTGDEPWMLIGEVYVDGLMYGQQDWARLSFDKVAIV